MKIRRGLTRTVILTRRWAIKLPSLRSHGDGAQGALWSLTRGIAANLSEAEWSGSSGTCPVRWSMAGLVNVYPRCAEPEHEPTDEDYTATGYIGPTDKKRSNVGVLNGQLVFLDYDQSWNDRPPCMHVTRSQVAAELAD
jgi:hypothetical protein